MCVSCAYLCVCGCPEFQLWTSPEPPATSVSLRRSRRGRRSAARRGWSAPDALDPSDELKHTIRAALIGVGAWSDTGEVTPADSQQQSHLWCRTRTSWWIPCFLYRRRPRCRSKRWRRSLRRTSVAASLDGKKYEHSTKNSTGVSFTALLNHDKLMTSHTTCLFAQ